MKNEPSGHHFEATFECVDRGENNLGRFDRFVCFHSHQHAICKDGDNYKEAKERMDEHVEGHPSDRIERVQYIQRFGCREAKNVLILTNNHECLNGGEGEGQKELERVSKPI